MSGKSKWVIINPPAMKLSVATSEGHCKLERPMMGVAGSAAPGITGAKANEQPANHEKEEFFQRKQIGRGKEIGG